MVAGVLEDAGEQAEQAPDPGGGERDQAGAGRRLVVQAGGRWQGRGALPGTGGGDGAHGEGGHGQHQVPADRGAGADLGTIEPEAALADLEVFLDGPATWTRVVKQAGRHSGTWQ